MSNLYLRQKKLDLWVPANALVIGIGGVGSWVALDLALLGVPSLVLVDPDTIEEHNLNRTPFRVDQVGENKATAMAELILERRPQADVIPVPFDVDKLGLVVENTSFDLVMDCRDTTAPLPEPLQRQVKVLGGYNGSSITFHLNPRPQSVWGQRGQGYQTVPSWVVPPQFIASVLVGLVSSARDLLDGSERTVTFLIPEFLKALFS